MVWSGRRYHDNQVSYCSYGRDHFKLAGTGGSRVCSACPATPEADQTVCMECMVRDRIGLLVGGGEKFGGVQVWAGGILQAGGTKSCQLLQRNIWSWQQRTQCNRKLQTPAGFETPGGRQHCALIPKLFTKELAQWSVGAGCIGSLMQTRREWASGGGRLSAQV